MYASFYLDYLAQVYKIQVSLLPMVLFEKRVYIFRYLNAPIVTALTRKTYILKLNNKNAS